MSGECERCMRGLFIEGRKRGLEILEVGQVPLYVPYEGMHPIAKVLP